MPYSHFTQMEGNYELKVAEGTDSHLVGIKIMTISDCCMFINCCTCNENFKYFYSNHEPVIDYDNKELVHFFFNELSKYVKSITVFI